MSWISNYALFPNVHFIHLVCVISLLLCIYKTCELFVRGDHIKPSSWNIDENEFTTFSMTSSSTFSMYDWFKVIWWKFRPSNSQHIRVHHSMSMLNFSPIYFHLHVLQNKWRHIVLPTNYWISRAYSRLYCEQVLLIVVSLFYDIATLLPLMFWLVDVWLLLQR